ncbi:MAG TPA: kynureninase [Cyclobacteriaceae bacterium]|jgi:kynureninase|nr:kynureninase [Cyclobacteriaceae bacterium]
MMKFENTFSFARGLDRKDSLRQFRSQFYIPKVKGKPVIYFNGNSLGLQPKTVKDFINDELVSWATRGVEGHFSSRKPWLHYHTLSKKILGDVVGAKPIEVIAMNQLTVNLHMLMASFYRPSKQRFKIITEAGAFSSDQYAFETQMKFHSVNPETSLIELSPRSGEYCLRTEDIIKAIALHADQLALVIFGGIQYYTGQFFDIAAITKAGHDAGAYAGFDLAHAVGNVPLNLHKDEVDFAVWCSYKYLNSGPGGIAGAFVHENHAYNFQLPRLAGWWGHDEGERFEMKKGFKPIAGVDGWQVSNFPVISGAAHLASLEIFKKAGIKRLRKKSILLTAYLEHLLHAIDPEEKKYSIITPSDPNQRGCQLSILIKSEGKKVFNKIHKKGVIADWRDPGVIRVAPTPLYNTFEEVFAFAKIFKESL